MTIAEYFSKMKGGGKGPPGVRAAEIFWSWLGATAGILSCAWLSAKYVEPHALPFLIGSFGSSAGLLYGASKSPLAQPRNLVGGHIIGGLVGVASQVMFGTTTWVAATLAVSFAIVAMLATKTFHPPAGATALIAVIGGPAIHRLGFIYPFFPVGTGVLLLLLVALLVNNLSANRNYPEYWF
jgi:CBS-domain-containing membrane protein